MRARSHLFSNLANTPRRGKDGSEVRITQQMKIIRPYLEDRFNEDSFNGQAKKSLQLNMTMSIENQKKKNKLHISTQHYIHSFFNI